MSRKKKKKERKSIRTKLRCLFMKYRNMNPVFHLITAVGVAFLLGIAAQLIILVMPVGALVWWKDILRTFAYTAANILKCCGFALRLIIFCEAIVMLTEHIRRKKGYVCDKSRREILSFPTKVVLGLSIPAVCFLINDSLSEIYFIGGIGSELSDIVVAVLNAVSYLFIALGLISFVVAIMSLTVEWCGRKACREGH